MDVLKARLNRRLMKMAQWIDAPELSRVPAAPIVTRKSVSNPVHHQVRLPQFPQVPPPKPPPRSVARISSGTSNGPLHISTPNNRVEIDTSVSSLSVDVVSQDGESVPQTSVTISIVDSAMSKADNIVDIQRHLIENALKNAMHKKDSSEVELNDHEYNAQLDNNDIGEVATVELHHDENSSNQFAEKGDQLQDTAYGSEEMVVDNGSLHNDDLSAHNEHLDN